MKPETIADLDREPEPLPPGLVQVIEDTRKAIAAAFQSERPLARYVGPTTPEER